MQNQLGNPSSQLFQMLAPAFQGAMQPIDPYSQQLTSAMANQSQIAPNFQQIMQMIPNRPGVNRNSPINAYTAAMGGAAMGGQNLMNRTMIPLNASIANAGNNLNMAGQASGLNQALVGLGNNQYLSDVNLQMGQQRQGISRLMQMLSPMFNTMLESY